MKEIVAEVNVTAAINMDNTDHQTVPLIIKCERNIFLY